MDKIIMLVIAATVLLVAGVSTMFMFSDVGNSQSNVNQAATSVECQTQVDEYCNGGVELSQLDTECIPEVENSCQVSQDQMDEEIADRGGLPVSP